MTLKKILTTALTATITAMVLSAVIFAMSGIYPGSEDTLLIFDMGEQFASFYSSLKALFRGESSILYSFQGSLGTAYLGTFAYYLASPVSLISLFFDTRHLPDAIWLMDIIKCGLAGGAFSVFIYYRGIKRIPENLFLSLCYALSSAVVTFFILPMYLDTLFWLPVICIFLEELLKSEIASFKMGIAYSISLALCMCIHYYSAYMVCVFLIMYAAFLLSDDSTILTVYDFGFGSTKRAGSTERADSDTRSYMKESVGSNAPTVSDKFLDKKGFVKKYLLFVLYSLLGALISSPFLFRVVSELSMGKLGDQGVYSDGSLLVSGPFDVLRQLFCGSYGYLYSEGAPEIYFTFFALILALYGLVRGGKNKLRRNVGIFIILFFLASFMLRSFYRIWHMFRDPVAYPHRFGFLFVFFMLVLAADGIKVLHEKYIKINVLICGIVFYGLLLMSSVLLVVNGLKLVRMDLATLPHISRSNLELFIDTTADLVEAAKEDSEEISLCRISKDYELTSNDPMLLGYNGLDYFSSVYDPDTLRLLKSIGLLQYHYKACDAGDTIVTGMILGNDYLIHNGQAEDGFTMVTSNGFATLSRNPYSLGAGYLVAGDMVEKLSFTRNPFYNQNLFIGTVLGEELNALTPVEFTESSKGYLGYSEKEDEEGQPVREVLQREKIYFTAPAGENIYLNFELLNESELDYETKANSGQIVVSVGNRIVAAFTGYQKAYNIFLGNYPDDTFVEVVIEGADDVREPYVYSLDIEKMQKAYSILSEGRFRANVLKGGYIEGRVVVTDESRNTLLFTVSYSDRFKVYVDGEKIEAKPYAGALLSVPGLKTGEHTVKVFYR